MIDYVNRVMSRVAPYVHHVRDEFKTSSGYTREEEDASARLRQFWADTDIPITEKLKELKLDLSDFNGNSTSNRELHAIGLALYQTGLLDMTGVILLGAIGSQYNAQGTQINRDTKLDAVTETKKQLSAVTEMVNGGYAAAKDMIPKQEFILTVLKGLQEYSKIQKNNNLIDITV
ncbi:hypothetical protein HX857_17790 [Pseudomonas gingeri]|uniref:hypothetical protein n=1 Tax=Pseudomonas gingeri TaxID=117681 RepID=UPI0015A37EDE|nr:hypothetical protein [Pseudomonas gingeri]NWE49124.1 hypothetical protein [Pseudomonas gingeri]NWE70552.1 hypothetical protein [Pseudomonas gingeri]